MKLGAKGVAVVVLSLVFMLSLSGLVLAERPALEIIKAAQKGFKVFSAGEFNLGFCSTEQWSAATLGEGFQIYTVKADQLLAEGVAGGSLKSRLEPTGLWCFEVRVNNMPVALIDVANFEGKWVAVGVGSAGLAQELGKMNMVLKGQGTDSFKFVRIYEAKADFLLVNQGYAPFESARVALQVSGDYDYQTLLSEAEIMAPLKDMVREQYKLMNEEN